MTPLEFPNNIQIQTTAFCNASCNFCPYPVTSKELPMGHMDEELYRSIVDQLPGRDIALLQPFLMNDPLMDKKIIPRLAYMKERTPNTRINITTNGALLRSRIADELAALDLDSIHISSNGINPKTYKETMGIDGALVLKNVNYLADALRNAGCKTELIVTSILLRETEEEIFVAREYWRSRGVTFYMNPLNDRAGNLGSGEFTQLLPFDADIQRTQLLNYDMSGCPALYSFLGILYNGDLVTCCMDWRRSLVLGNAREKSLYELWHDRPYQQIRRLSDEGRLGERELCRKCGENRFSIDKRALVDLLQRQSDGSRPSAALSAARKLSEAHAEDPELIKMNLIRPE